MISPRSCNSGTTFLLLLLSINSFLPCCDALIRSKNPSSKQEDIGHATTTSSNTQAGRGVEGGQLMDIVVDTETGAATIWIDEQPWFSIEGGGVEVIGWGILSLSSSEITHDNVDPIFGNYTTYHFVWKGNGTDTQQQQQQQQEEAQVHILETRFLVFTEGPILVLEQSFPNGWINPKKDVNYRSGSSIVAGFPSISPHLPLASTNKLGFLVWGDCFASDTNHGDWRDVQSSPNDLINMFNGHTHGQPWVLHDPQSHRAIVTSSLDNYFVSGMAYNNETNTIQAGLRNSLQEIPRGHVHTSVVVAGRDGINSTLWKWGDVLLAKGGGKQRSNVYDDFILAHAGYFTDNGAFHYHAKHQPEYKNMEEALLGVKKAVLEDQNVPIRYVQWDDWWMETKGDLPGMLSWTPKQDVFPSGFSNWLDMPLSLYAPAYSGENIWINEYHWETVPTDRGSSSIPLDPKFYMDLFRNGTKIGMKLFEQDFLCSYGIGGYGLTSKDVNSGRLWLSQMDQAALAYNITLQLCMPDGYHLLQSTTLRSVTNARATYDNTRNGPSIHSMGQNSLLFHALGIFASRDNVWTSSATVEQKGCGNSDFCYEPNAPLDNAVTTLSNGPYGIADAYNYVNRTIVMYACRTDGWMLRPRFPLASLDFSYTDEDAKGSKIWAAHDDYGALRWSYLVGVRLDKAISITPKRLVQGAFDISPQQEMVAWKVVPGLPIGKVEIFSEKSPFLLPKSEPLNLPYDVVTPPHTMYNVAPVLSNGIVVLGEVEKWATMSFGRVSQLEGGTDALKMQVVGAPAEQVTFAYIKHVKTDATIRNATFRFPETCSQVDQHKNPICLANLVCRPDDGCSFVGVDDASIM